MRVTIAKLLNLRQHETALVFRLMGVQFLMGLGIAFMLVGSYSFFLYRYSIPQLPWVYIAIATLLFPVNGLYAWLDERINSFKLMQYALLFAAGIVATCLSLWWIAPLFETAVLLVAVNVVAYMVIGYGFWGMTSLLFDVRESRRVFSVIGAGDLPAKLLGYSLAAVLPKSIGNEMLIATAVLFFLAAALAARYLIGSRVIDWESFEHSQHTQHHQHTRLHKWLRRFMGNSLIVSIAGISFAGYLVFFLMDFTFLSEIKVRNKSAKELMTFITIFLAVGRMLAIIFKLVFSSRVLSRLGIMTTLLITPCILITLGATIVWLGQGSGGQVNTNLYLFGAMWLLAEVLRSAVQEPVFFVLFQPLNIHLRLKGHLIAKGYVLPPALFLVGSGLLWWHHQYDRVPITSILTIVIVILLAWISLVPLVRRMYFRTVEKALGKGIFSGAALFLNDKTVEQSLLQKLQEGSPFQVIHALDLLERSEYEELPGLLLKKLMHPAVEVRQFVLAHPKLPQLPGVAEALAAMKQANYQAGIEEAFVAACLKLPAASHALLDDQLQNDVMVQALLLQHYLEQDKPEGRMMLREWCLSNDSNKKIQAARAIGSVGYKDALHLLEQMLLDDVDAVRMAVLLAAAKTRAYSMVPEMLKCLNNTAFQDTAKQCLAEFGDALFDMPALAADRLKPEWLPALILLGATSQTPLATRFMITVGQQYPAMQKQVAAALWGQRAEVQGEHRSVMANWLNAHLAQAAQKRTVHEGLKHFPAFEGLQHALLAELATTLESGLRLAGVLYGRQHMRRAMDILEAERYGQASTALEMVELALPQWLATPMCNLLEYLVLCKQGKFSMENPPKGGLTHCLHTIFSHANDYTEWTLALAMYLVAKHGQPAQWKWPLLRTENRVHQPLIQETWQYLNAQLKTA